MTTRIDRRMGLLAALAWLPHLNEFGDRVEDPPPRGMSPAPPRVVLGVGRNEPCPCGSGRKFKRCCFDGPGGLKP